MDTTNKNFWLLIIVLVLVVGVLVSYLYGAKKSGLQEGALNYRNGFFQGQNALRDAQKAATEKAAAAAAAKAANEAAQSANPFQVDPFAKVKDVLNPFK